MGETKNHQEKGPINVLQLALMSGNLEGIKIIEKICHWKQTQIKALKMLGLCMKYSFKSVEEENEMRRFIENAVP